MSSRDEVSNLERGLRLFFGLVVGYFGTAATIGALGPGLNALGLAKAEAVELGLILGLFIWPGFAVWIAATRRPIVLTTAITTAAVLVFTVF
ncbi:MAG: hypothetical protein AAGH76_12505 [Pseudomonadota bacterium]